MKNDEIYLVGFLTGMSVDRYQILMLLRKRAGVKKSDRQYSVDDVIEMQQQFTQLFPQGFIPLLCRWTLTLSEMFTNTALQYYNPETHAFSKGIGTHMNIRFRRVLRACRVASQNNSTIQPAETFSAVYLHSSRPNHRKATVESLFYCWATLAADPSDINGLNMFLRRLIGYNDQINRMSDLIYGSIADPSPYIRGQIIATFIPNTLKYLEWLSRDNPFDNNWFDPESSIG